MSKQPLILDGLEQLTLLSAFQGLSLWSGAYGVSHGRCRDIIAKLTGYRPIRGRQPEMPPRDHDNVLQWYCDWLMDNSRRERTKRAPDCRACGGEGYGTEPGDCPVCQGSGKEPTSGV